MNRMRDSSCCIVGGGPAGMMTGFLLARAGINVVVLEKHADFNRDFRGDTIHPSTFELMHELGLLDEFLKVPHQEVEHLKGMFNETEVEIADFTKLNVAKPALGIMPQWDFLNFLAKHAAKYRTFTLIKEANVKELIWTNDKVTGVVAHTPNGLLQVPADVVIGTDGRHSTVREQAKLQVITTGVPIDVLWFRISRKHGDPHHTLGHFYHGSIMILLERGDYWQCGYVIEKDGYEHVKQKGLDAFRKELLKICPFLGDEVAELKTWDDIKLLSVAIDHLEQWCCDGLVCIGDAAHAMSPVGGVGINLAIQDAVATANILYKQLAANKEITTETLQRVQERREFPARVIQKIQAQIHKGIAETRHERGHTGMPLMFRLLRMLPVLRRIPAHIVGMGVRPEHVETPDNS